MNTYYVSLTKDLIGCYLVVTADSEMAVRYYLANEYRASNGEWKLPWCSIYAERPKATSYETPIFIHSFRMQNLFEENETREFEITETARRLADDTSALDGDN